MSDHLEEFLHLKSLSVEDICNSTSVTEVIPSTQKVVVIPATATIDQALSTLSAHQILSAPVLSSSPSNDPNIKIKYAGFIDMFDIMTYLVTVISQDKKMDDTHPHIHSWVLNKEALAQIAEEFCTHPVSKCVGISKRNPFAAISTHAKVSHLVYFFKKDLHRVAVVDKTEIVNVVSQSTLIQFLAKNITQTNWSTVTLESVNLGTKTAIVMQTSSRAIHVFHTMHSHGISAVPIVDKSGILIATLSVSDLRQLSISNFASLMNPVLEYISKNVKKISPVTVSPKDTIETAILKLAATKVHRLWVVDDWGKPISVISLSDLINFVDLRIYSKQEDAILDFEASM